MDREIYLALVRLIIALPVVCFLAYLAVKYGLGNTKRNAVYGKKRMRLLEQVSLGPKCGLSLVQVGNKYILLAHQEGSMAVIKEMDEPPAELSIDATDRPNLSQRIKSLKPFTGKHKE